MGHGQPNHRKTQNVKLYDRLIIKLSSIKIRNGITAIQLDYHCHTCHPNPRRGLIEKTKGKLCRLTDMRVEW